ncbi:unnamed protein product [Paramecium pentaurelia]|uniref:Transmembrane protein n=1 Tax=Paramecium pentaurelia TaxID=43138 RepID=A0A8S1YL10_9CILI|nr:unnamed protein product [Paramecium pentaurelia]
MRMPIFLGCALEIYNYFQDLILNNIYVLIIIILHLMVVSLLFMIVLKVVVTALKVLVQIVQLDGNSNNLIKVVYQFVMILQQLVFKYVMMEIKYLMMVVINVRFLVFQTAYFVNLKNVQNLVLFFELSDDKQKCIRKCDNNAFKNIIDTIMISMMNCKLCINYQCYLCEYGWQLRDNYCYLLCGDGEVAYSIEQCEDSNNIPNDRCFEYQLECLPHCLQCLDIYTCLICQDNFQKQQNYYVCQSVVMVLSSLNLRIVIMVIINLMRVGNICKKCDNKFVLNRETAVCQEQNTEQIFFDPITDNQYNVMRGNGILNIQEECDDNNVNNLDGCSNQCKIEDKWDFVQTIFQSQCFLLTSFYLEFIFHTNSYQYVSLSFSNLVKLNESIFNLIPRIKVQIDIYLWNSIIIQFKMHNKSFVIYDNCSRLIRFEMRITFKVDTSQKSKSINFQLPLFQIVIKQRYLLNYITSPFGLLLDQLQAVYY